MAWPPTTHQDVEDDLTNGHGWATSLIERFGLGDQLLPTPFAWVTGRYYASTMTGLATATVAGAANRLYLMPMYFPTSRTIDQIAVNVSTAGTASHVARLGIYNSTPSTGLPSTVKVDAGTVAVDSTGAKTLTVSTTLTGLHWLGIAPQSGTFTAIALGAVLPIGGAGSVSGSVGSCLTRDSTTPTSPLPDLTGDATVTPTTITNIPRVLVRAA